MKTNRISNLAVTIAVVSLMLTVVLGCNSRSDAEWKDLLGGNKLSRADNSGSVSTKTTIYFCPTGDYAMQIDFSGYSTGGAGTLSMADNDVELGRWQVDAGVLKLQSQEGKTHEYSLGESSERAVVKLDGSGYMLAPHNECGE